MVKFFSLFLCLINSLLKLNDVILEIGIIDGIPKDGILKDAILINENENELFIILVALSNIFLAMRSMSSLSSIMEIIFTVWYVVWFVNKGKKVLVLSNRQIHNAYWCIVRHRKVSEIVVEPYISTFNVFDFKLFEGIEKTAWVTGSALDDMSNRCVNSSSQWFRARDEIQLLSRYDLCNICVSSCLFFTCMLINNIKHC